MLWLLAFVVIGAPAKGKPVGDIPPPLEAPEANGNEDGVSLYVKPNTRFTLRAGGVGANHGNYDGVRLWLKKTPFELVVLSKGEQKQVLLSALPIKTDLHEVTLVARSNDTVTLMLSLLEQDDAWLRKFGPVANNNSPAAPKLPHDEWGIWLRAPKRVDWAAEAKLPSGYTIRQSDARIPRIIVALSYQAKHRAMFDAGVRLSTDRPALVAAEVATGREVFREKIDLIYERHSALTRSIDIWGDYLPPYRGHFDKRPDDKASSSTSFTVDIGWLLPAPTAEIAYDIFAELGPYKSEKWRIVLTP